MMAVMIVSSLVSMMTVKLISASSVMSRGLLDRSTARYFYKGPKTSLHKHTGNLVENLFSKKCAFKNYLQLLT
jgi:hypothetical protein